jgi:hypothetical protein
MRRERASPVLDRHFVGRTIDEPSIPRWHAAWMQVVVERGNST